jgi:hypothetical protein
MNAHETIFEAVHPEHGVTPIMIEEPLYSEEVTEQKSQQQRQRLRSLAIAWALGGMAVIFFLVTIVRVGGNIIDRPL